MAIAELNVETVEFSLDGARVVSWRYEQLQRAGYEPEAAIELAERSNVDLHRAVELLERGCTPATALKILL